MSAAELPDLEGRQAPGGFSLDLTDEQRDVRDWVHGFAERVVRPAASEWDEREETPWPVIAEAAKIGLYSFEALAQFHADTSGITMPLVSEELFWGDAGIGMAIMATTLAVAALELLAHGAWSGVGVLGPEAFDAVPFLDKLAELGAPHGMDERDPARPLTRS